MAPMASGAISEVITGLSYLGYGASPMSPSTAFGLNPGGCAFSPHPASVSSDHYVHSSGSLTCTASIVVRVQIFACSERDDGNGGWISLGCGLPHTETGPTSSSSHKEPCDVTRDVQVRSHVYGYWFDARGIRFYAGFDNSGKSPGHCVDIKN
jgi:hypothetical protein